MGKATIIEAQNSNTQYENGKRKGVLGKLKGIFADYRHGTRNNGRLYSEELWDNRVFGSEDVMEALKTRTLFGELDHPEGDRNETLAQNAAISITKLEKRPEEGVIYGEADILDTPTGRIVKSLADSGAQLGISSRGLGEEIYREGKTIIDPDTYDFITFDVVVTPANKKARVCLAESKHLDTLTESFKKEISDSETTNQLNQIKTALESTSLQNKSELLKLIESKSDVLQNKKVVKHNISKLNRDIALKFINNKYENARTELQEVKSLSQDTINENAKLLKEKDFLKESKNELKSKLKEALLKNKNQEIELEAIKTKSDNILNENKDLKLEVSKLNNKLEESNNSLQETINKLTEQLNESNSKIVKLTSENNRLNESLSNKDTEINKLNESNNRKLQESKQLKDTEINKLQTKVNELTDQVNKLTTTNEKYEKLSFEPIGKASLLTETLQKNNNISDDDKQLYDMLVSMYNN